MKSERVYKFPVPETTGGAEFQAATSSFVGGLPVSVKIICGIVSVLALGGVVTGIVVGVQDLVTSANAAVEQEVGSGENPVPSVVSTSPSPPLSPPAEVIMNDPSPGGVGASLEITFSPSSPPVPPAPPMPAAPECSIAGGLCPDVGTNPNPGLADVNLGTEASNEIANALYREQCRALCEENQLCNYYSVQWSDTTGIIRCKTCATNTYYWGTYLDRSSLYGPCNPPALPPPSPPPLSPRTTRVQAHPAAVSVRPGSCADVRWTLNEPVIAAGEPGYVTLYFSIPTYSGLILTPEMLRWDQNVSWQEIQTVRICTHPMHTSLGTYDSLANVMSNAEYYGGFVPQFVLDVAYR